MWMRRSFGLQVSVRIHLRVEALPIVYITNQSGFRHDLDFVEIQFLYPNYFDADNDVGSPCAVFNLHAF